MSQDVHKIAREILESDSWRSLCMARDQYEKPSERYYLSMSHEMFDKIRTVIEDKKKPNSRSQASDISNSL